MRVRRVPHTLQKLAYRNNSCCVRCILYCDWNSWTQWRSDRVIANVVFLRAARWSATQTGVRESLIFRPQSFTNPLKAGTDGWKCTVMWRRYCGVAVQYLLSTSNWAGTAVPFSSTTRSFWVSIKAPKGSGRTNVTGTSPKQIVSN